MTVISGTKGKIKDNKYKRFCDLTLNVPSKVQNVLFCSTLDKRAFGMSYTVNFNSNVHHICTICTRKKHLSLGLVKGETSIIWLTANGTRFCVLLSAFTTSGMCHRVLHAALFVVDGRIPGELAEKILSK